MGLLPIIVLYKHTPDYVYCDPEWSEGEQSDNGISLTMLAAK